MTAPAWEAPPPEVPVAAVWTSLSVEYVSTWINVIPIAPNEADRLRMRIPAATAMSTEESPWDLIREFGKLLAEIYLDSNLPVLKEDALFRQDPIGNIIAMVNAFGEHRHHHRIGRCVAKPASCARCVPDELGWGAIRRCCRSGGCTGIGGAFGSGWRKQTLTQPAGLTTLASDEFPAGPRVAS